MSDALVKAYTQQQSPAISGDGQWNVIRSTRDGCMFTADWKVNLVMRGMAFNVTVGGISAGADILLVTGGGDGTVIDTNQPEMLIQTPATHFHIPLSCRAAIQNDIGAADADEVSILLFADTTPAAIIASATATSEVPHPLLDGGIQSVSTCFSAVTVDITSPTADMVLDFETSQAAQVSAAGTISHQLKMIFEPSYPIFLRGPVAVVGCWGGNQAADGLMTYCWAEVPLSHIE